MLALYSNCQSLARPTFDDRRRTLADSSRWSHSHILLLVVIIVNSHIVIVVIISHSRILLVVIIVTSHIVIVVIISHSHTLLVVIISHSHILVVVVIANCPWWWSLSLSSIQSLFSMYPSLEGIVRHIRQQLHIISKIPNIQGVFSHWASPKTLKYGKPR